MRYTVTNLAPCFLLFLDEFTVDCLGTTKLLLKQFRFLVQVFHLSIDHEFDGADLPSDTFDLLDQNPTVVSDFLVEELRLLVKALFETLKLSYRSRNVVYLAALFDSVEIKFLIDFQDITFRQD